MWKWILTTLLLTTAILTLTELRNTSLEKKSDSFIDNIFTLDTPSEFNKYVGDTFNKKSKLNYRKFTNMFGDNPKEVINIEHENIELWDNTKTFKVTVKNDTGNTEKYKFEIQFSKLQQQITGLRIFKVNTEVGPVI